MRLFCMLGLHKRSRGRARHNGDYFESVCKRCRRAMWRDPKGKWRLNPPGADEAQSDNQSSTAARS